MKILSDEFEEHIASQISYKNTLDGIKEANSNNLDRMQKYRTLLYKCKRDHIDVKIAVDKMYRKLYHKYKFNYNHSLTATEIRDYIIANKDYVVVNKKLSLKNLEIERVADAIKGLEQRGWNIKNSIELYKLENPY